MMLVMTFLLHLTASSKLSDHLQCSTTILESIYNPQQNHTYRYVLYWRHSSTTKQNSFLPELWRQAEGKAVAWISQRPGYYELYFDIWLHRNGDLVKMRFIHEIVKLRRAGTASNRTSLASIWKNQDAEYEDASMEYLINATTIQLNIRSDFVVLTIDPGGSYLLPLLLSTLVLPLINCILLWKWPTFSTKTECYQQNCLWGAILVFGTGLRSIYSVENQEASLCNYCVAALTVCYVSQIGLRHRNSRQHGVGYFAVLFSELSFLMLDSFTLYFLVNPTIRYVLMPFYHGLFLAPNLYNRYWLNKPITFSDISLIGRFVSYFACKYLTQRSSQKPWKLGNEFDLALLVIVLEVPGIMMQVLFICVAPTLRRWRERVRKRLSVEPNHYVWVESQPMADQVAV